MIDDREQRPHVHVDTHTHSHSHSHSHSLSKYSSHSHSSSHGKHLDSDSFAVAQSSALSPRRDLFTLYAASTDRPVTETLVPFQFDALTAQAQSGSRDLEHRLSADYDPAPTAVPLFPFHGLMPPPPLPKLKLPAFKPSSASLAATPSATMPYSQRFPSLSSL